MRNKIELEQWDIIGELTDKNVLGLEGMSKKEPRRTARAIVKNGEGLYAVLYAKKFDLYSLPGGGIEDGENEVSTLIREMEEETNQRKFLQARDMVALTEYRKLLQ